MALGTAAAVIGGAGAIAQTVAGAKQKRDTKKALESYQRQEFSNVADNLSVYTHGVEMQMEESARLGASSVDALSRSGARGVIGGVGRLQQSQQMQQRQIAADLEQQQARIDQIRVQDEARIRQMREQREMQDIAALSSQQQAGQQQMWSGIGGIAQAGISGLQMIQEEELAKAKIAAG